MKANALSRRDYILIFNDIFWSDYEAFRNRGPASQDLVIKYCHHYRTAFLITWYIMRKQLVARVFASETRSMAKQL